MYKFDHNRTQNKNVTIKIKGRPMYNILYMYTCVIIGAQELCKQTDHEGTARDVIYVAIIPQQPIIILISGVLCPVNH